MLKDKYSTWGDYPFKSTTAPDRGLYRDSDKNLYGQVKLHQARLPLAVHLAAAVLCALLAAIVTSSGGATVLSPWQDWALLTLIFYSPTLATTTYYLTDSAASH